MFSEYGMKRSRIICIIVALLFLSGYFVKREYVCFKLSKCISSSPTDFPCFCIRMASSLVILGSVSLISLGGVVFVAKQFCNKITLSKTWIFRQVPRVIVFQYSQVFLRLLPTCKFFDLFMYIVYVVFAVVLRFQNIFSPASFFLSLCIFYE